MRARTSVRWALTYRVQIVMLAAIWIAFAVTTSSFRGSGGVYSVLLGFAPLGLLALGAGVTMLAGELDLSVAAVATAAGVIAVRTSDLGLVPSVLIATCAGLLFGLAQGWVIARFAVNSLIVTVGTMILIGGVGSVLCGGKPINVNDLAVSDPLLSRWWIVNPSIVIALLVFAVVGAFLTWTRYGREIYAIGGGRQEAVSAGVPLRRTVVTSFAISASLASLGGALASLTVGSVAPGAFNPLLLQSISAALVGGLALTGGRGTAVNIALGVAILSLVSAGFSSNGATDATVLLITGALLLVVVIFEFVLGRPGHGGPMRTASALQSDAALTAVQHSGTPSRPD